MHTLEVEKAEAANDSQKAKSLLEAEHLKALEDQRFRNENIISGLHLDVANMNAAHSKVLKDLKCDVINLQKINAALKSSHMHKVAGLNAEIKRESDAKLAAETELQVFKASLVPHFRMNTVMSIPSRMSICCPPRTPSIIITPSTPVFSDGPIRSVTTVHVRT